MFLCSCAPVFLSRSCYDRALIILCQDEEETCMEIEAQEEDMPALPDLDSQAKKEVEEMLGMANSCCVRDPNMYAFFLEELSFALKRTHIHPTIVMNMKEQ